MRKYKDLIIWQRSVDLATSIYKITTLFPSEEKYGLISQMRRCSVSIPSNIAEGSGRSSDKEFSRFLEIAYGSAYELETQMIISMKLEFVQINDYEVLSKELDELQKMIFAFINKLKH